MSSESLANWRDAAVILLVLEAFVLLLLPAVVLWFANKGMRWVNKRAKPFFVMLHPRVHQVEDVIVKVMNKTAVPFVAAPSALAGIQRGMKVWIREEREFLEERFGT